MCLRWVSQRESTVWNIVAEQRKFSRNFAGEDADFSKYFSLLYVTSVLDVHNSHVEEERLQLNKT
jgi:hypothetical protein